MQNGDGDSSMSESDGSEKLSEFTGFDDTYEELPTSDSDENQCVLQYTWIENLCQLGQGQLNTIVNNLKTSADCESDSQKHQNKLEAYNRFKKMLDEANALLEDMQKQGNSLENLKKQFDRYWLLNQGLVTGFSILSEVNKLRKNPSWWNKNRHLEKTATRFDVGMAGVYTAFCLLGSGITALSYAVERGHDVADIGRFGAVSIETFTAAFAWNMFDAVGAIILGSRQIMRGQPKKGTLNLVNGIQLATCTSLAYSARFSSIVASNGCISTGTAAAPGMVAMHLFSWSFAAAMFMSCAVEVAEACEARSREKYALERVDQLFRAKFEQLDAESPEAKALTLFKEEKNPVERARLGKYLITVASLNNVSEKKASASEDQQKENQLLEAYINTAIRERAQIKKHEASACVWLGCGLAMSGVAIVTTATYGFVGPVADMLIMQGITIFSAIARVVLAKNGGILRDHANDAEKAITGKHDDIMDAQIIKKYETKTAWDQTFLGRSSKAVNEALEYVFVPKIKMSAF